MKRVRKTVWVTAALLTMGTTAVSAQDKVEVNVGADLVSSYVWRGVYQSGVSFQPSIDVGYKGFSLGVWGSTDFDDFKEVDFSLSYAIGGFEIGLTDYWWDGQFQRYFNISKSHRLEATVAYTFGPAFPLTASWSTFIAGEDTKMNGNRAYSTYIELSYPFHVGPVEMAVAVGAAPWEAPTWLPTSNTGFQVANIAVSAAKDIKITESFSLPVFAQLSVNPAVDDINLVVGFSF